jgi:hypothetical protein
VTQAVTQRALATHALRRCVQFPPRARTAAVFSAGSCRADQPGQYQGQTDRDERDHSGDGNGVRPRRMAAGSRAGDMGRNFAKVVRAKSIPPGPHVRECASLQDAPSISYDRAVPRVAATGLVAMEPNGATSGYGDEQACDQDSTSHLRGEPTVALGLAPPSVDGRLQPREIRRHPGFRGEAKFIAALIHSRVGSIVGHGQRARSNVSLRQRSKVW